MKPVLPSLYTGLLCAALSFSALPEAHAQFTYTYYPADATINNPVTTDFAIVGFAGGSYDESDFSRHFTGPSSPTVQVVTGANVSSEIDSFNSSVVNVSGGSVGFLSPYDNSVVNISGGSIGGILSDDAAIINVSGGTVDDLEGQGKQINVSGGTVGTLVANTNTDYLGNSLGSCIVNVTGGFITAEADAYNDGILNLYGGQFGGNVYARFGGTINVFGNGLRATLLDANYRNTFSLYSLSGLLADGTTLNNQNIFIENDGVTYGHSSFRLVNAVPEPGACTLLLGVGASGGCLMAHRHRFTNRNKRHSVRKESIS